VLKTNQIVDDALVTVFESPFGKALAAYIVTDEEYTLQHFNNLLKEWIPHTSLLPAMRPVVYIPLREFPKNAAGKADRAALPNPALVLEQLAQTDDEVLEDPETVEEREMAECWANVLNVHISANKPFATYGGHSLTAMRLRSEVVAVFGKMPDIAFLMSETCTVRSLLQHLASQSAPASAINAEVEFPFVCEKTHKSYYHMETTTVSKFGATHRLLKHLPESVTQPVHAFFVEVFEIHLEEEVDDLQDLVSKVLVAHPILRAKYSTQRELVISDGQLDVQEYCSWDRQLWQVRHSIFGMYDRPLFHVIGHRGQKKLTVVWHHMIMDDFSEDILRKDISALMRGQHVQPPDLTMYTRIARHPVRAELPEQHPSRSIQPFKFAPKLHCNPFFSRSKVAHTVTMFAAVSQKKIENDIDRLRDFLDSWCAVTMQETGRLGLVTNARAKVDEDATRLIGALLYTLEWAYDSTSRTLTPLNCSINEDAPGLVINTYSTDRMANELVEEIGFASSQQIVAGSTKGTIRQEFAGTLGVNFSEGNQVLVECVSAADATVYIGIYNTGMYDAHEQVRSLQRRLIAP
jgi:hypothetical protein